MRATVLALGDLGRSPRIQLHAKALAGAGCDVDLVGFSGSRCWLLDGTPGVTAHFIDDGQGHRARVLRGLSLSLSLSRVLRSLASPDVVVVQTPPAIPALSLAARFGRARGARVVFDWHNLGFSLVALRAGRRSLAARLYEMGERRASSGAHAHLCVTSRMKKELKNRFGVEARVFEDRPSQAFAPVAEEQRAGLRREILSRVGLGDLEGGLIVVSPTSWTRDEEIQLVESAADALDALPGGAMVFVICGRGESKSAFEQRVARRSAGRARLATAWFEDSDYARLLPGADLGLSLHASSSGADFPMKIRDLQGAGVPVLALRFPGLADGFIEGSDGHGFDTAAELAQLLSRFEGDRSALAAMRRTDHGLSWEEAWQREARPVILGS